MDTNLPEFAYYNGTILDLQHEFNTTVRDWIRSRIPLERLVTDESILPEPAMLLVELKTAWQRHNELGVYIDKTLNDIWGRDITSFSHSNLIFLANLVIYAAAADDRKRKASILIKPVIEKELNRTHAQEKLSTEEITTLLGTVSHTAYLQRRYDLLGLAYTEMTGDMTYGNFNRPIIAQKYFAGSVEYLQAYMPTSLTVEEVYMQLQSIKERKEEMDIHKVYLLIDHPSLRNLEELLRFDNLDEYLYMMNMYGMPEYLLRRYITEELTTNGLMQEKGNPLFYSPEEIRPALIELAERTDTKEENNESLQKQKEIFYTYYKHESPPHDDN